MLAFLQNSSSFFENHGFSQQEVIMASLQGRHPVAAAAAHKRANSSFIIWHTWEISRPRCVPRAREAKLSEHTVSLMSFTLGLTCTSIKVFDWAPEQQNASMKCQNHLQFHRQSARWETCSHSLKLQSFAHGLIVKHFHSPWGAKVYMDSYTISRVDRIQVQFVMLYPRETKDTKLKTVWQSLLTYQENHAIVG